MKTLTHSFPYIRKVTFGELPMKKICILLLGSLFVLLALVFIIVPGPSVVFLLAALVCYSMYYPRARTWLKKVQSIFTKACYKLDRLK
ncbi:PGPGW domain-containing protein [Pseudoalteromonas sp. T1lg23B]|uniref:PGPGW domain-containing protein n=1 Tax=Pseudoalteromonas sp. T1lg23B TaxID=2077097 RepID=UPI002D76DC96|nr:PGPGW domain-containing protein [Pseudoalteromonas sp. T1lg23B]